MSSTPNSIRCLSIIEGLEDRRLMAASITFAEGVLTVQGDVAVANNIRVYAQPRTGNLVALAGRIRRTFPLAGVLAISVTGGDLPTSSSSAKTSRRPPCSTARRQRPALRRGRQRHAARRRRRRQARRSPRQRHPRRRAAPTRRRRPGPQHDRSRPRGPARQRPRPLPGGGQVDPDAVLPSPITLVHPNGGSSPSAATSSSTATPTACSSSATASRTTPPASSARSTRCPSRRASRRAASPRRHDLLPAGHLQDHRAAARAGRRDPVGAGPDTVINYVGNGGAAVEFVDDGVGFCSGAGATNLTVRAANGGGFCHPLGVALIMTQMRFRDLVLDTAGWGIDFRGGTSYTQNCFFDNVLFRGVGAGGIHIAGNANKLNGIRTDGTVRPSFRSDSPVVFVDGDGTAVSNSLLAGLPPTRWGSTSRAGAFGSPTTPSTPAARRLPRAPGRASCSRTSKGDTSTTWAGARPGSSTRTASGSPGSGPTSTAPTSARCSRPTPRAGS